MYEEAGMRALVRVLTTYYLLLTTGNVCMLYFLLTTC